VRDKKAARKRHLSITKKQYPDLPALLFVVVLATLLRFLWISALPIFNDEAIYGQWVQIIRLQHNWGVPFLDGKQPLYYWLVAVVHLLGVSPLTALRAVSAGVGVIGVVLTYLAGARIFGGHAGVAAAALYAVIPFLLLHDRLGVPDGTLAALAPAVLLSGFEVGKGRGSRHAFILFLLFATAFLIKTTGILLLPAAIAGVLLSGFNLGALSRAVAAAAAGVMVTLISIPFFPTVFIVLLIGLVGLKDAPLIQNPAAFS
jgi:4-amino-4-deoxy-L-arabinose transferase-like glycosyltransferase